MLVIAVIGGLRHPIGPFLGAALFVFLQTFAIDICRRGALQYLDRRNLSHHRVHLRRTGYSACGGESRRLLAQRPLREA